MIQEKITQYLKYKGITPYKFCKQLGFSMGYLDKTGAIGTDKYLKIIEYYDDINPDWLLTGRGSMLRGSNHGIISIGDGANNSLIRGGKEHKVEQVQGGKTEQREHVCLACNAKDKTILSLEKQILLLEKQNLLLEKQQTK